MTMFWMNSMISYIWYLETKPSFTRPLSSARSAGTSCLMYLSMPIISAGQLLTLLNLSDMHFVQLDLPEDLVHNHLQVFYREVRI